MADLGLGVTLTGRDAGTVKTLREAGKAADDAKKSVTALNTATTAQAAAHTKSAKEVTGALEKQRRETEAVAKATTAANKGAGSGSKTVAHAPYFANVAGGNATSRGGGAKQDKNGRWRDEKGKFLTGDALDAAMGKAPGTSAAEKAKGKDDGFFGSSDKSKGRRSDAGGEAQSALGGAATAFGALGAAGLLGLGMAEDAASGFELAVRKVSTIASEAEFPLGKIRDVGFSMQSAYGGTLTEQMGALYNAIGSGADKASDATELMTQSNKLAIGGITTVDKAMYGLVGTANAYGIAYADAGKVSDAFFAAVKLGGSDMSVDTLASKLSGVTPIASAMGVSLNELLASLARLTAVGVPTAEAVTGMKATIEGIIRPTADSAKEAKRLGVEFNQAALKSKGILGVLRDVQSSAKFNDESFKKLFTSTEALNAALALSANGGSAAAGMLEEMNNAAGSTDAAFLKIAGTSKFAGAMLKGSFEQALVKVGQAVITVAGPIMAFANKVLVAFNSLPPAVGEAVGGLIMFASVASLAMGAGLALAAGITAVALAGEAVFIGVGVAVVVVGALSGAFLALGAVVGSVAAIYSANLGGLGTLADGALAKVTLAYNGIKAALSGGISGGLLDELGKGGNEKVFGFVQTVVGGVNLAKRAFAGLQIGFNDTMAALSPTFDALRVAVQTFFDLFSVGAPTTGSAFQEMGTTASATGAAVGGVFATLIGWATRGITAAVNFGTAVVTGFEKIGIVGGAGVDGSADSFGAVGGHIGRFVAIGVNGALLFVRVFGSALSSLITFGANVVGVFSGLGTVIGGAISIVQGIVNGNWKMVMDGFYSIGFGAIESLLSVIGMFVSAVGGQIDTLGAAFGKDLGIVKNFEKAKTDVLSTVGQASGRGPASAAIGGGAVASTGPAKIAGLGPDGKPIASGLGSLATPGEAVARLPGLTAAQSAALTVPGIKPASAGGGSVAPGVTAGGGTAAPDFAALMKPQAPPPVNVTTTTSVILDGQKVGEAVEKYMAQSGARGFGATPSTTLGIAHGRPSTAAHAYAPRHR